MLTYGLIAFASVFASGLILLLVKIPRNPMKMLLAFSGAFLFAMSMLHLVPELYTNGGAEVGIWILVGFMIQLLLEYVSEGVEHGHVHNHEAHHHDKSKVPVGIISGLCLHSFLEGMPLGVNTDSDTIFTPFLTGIVLHNVPVAIAFMGILLHHGNTKMKAALWLMLFAVMTPLGMLAAHFAGSQLTGDLEPYFNIVTAIVVGIFLHISTTILFETSENHRFNAMKFITILFGILTAWLVTQTV
jgi:zinc and cadmium transporter